MFHVCNLNTAQWNSTLLLYCVLRFGLRVRPICIRYQWNEPIIVIQLRNLRWQAWLNTKTKSSDASSNFNRTRNVIILHRFWMQRYLTQCIEKKYRKMTHQVHTNRMQFRTIWRRVLSCHNRLVTIIMQLHDLTLP